MTYGWLRLAGDGLVATSPAFIAAIIVSPNGASNNATVTLYDGENTGEPKVLTVYTGTGTTKSIVFTEPLKLNRGLYVEAGSHLGEVLILYCRAGQE